MNSTLAYPYECTLGGKCSYEGEHADSVEQECEALSPSTTHGFCPIIKGVREYSLYREAVLPLVLLASNCTRDLHSTPQMTGALALCTTATASQ